MALEPGVTCLVGKNESGKTAFLEPADREKLDALAERTESQQRLLAELRSFDLHARVTAVLARRLPKFLYFDEYNILPGRFSIPYLQREQETLLKRVGAKTLSHDRRQNGESR